MDRHLKAWDQRTSASLSNRFASQVPKIVIIEIKCSKEHYPQAERLVRALPLNVGRCSKFVMASSPGEGPLLVRL